MKARVAYVNILSNDQERLIDFYENVVGLSPLKRQPGSSWHGFECEDAGFAIEPMSNRDKYQFEYAKENPVLIQFYADNLDHLTKWTEKLESHGVVIGQRLMKKSYGTVTTFVDPDGNVIELLYQEDE